MEAGLARRRAGGLAGAAENRPKAEWATSVNRTHETPWKIPRRLV